MDIKTGRVLWQTKMIPDNGGKFGFYSGAAVWGSSPPIDKKRRHVYMGTGNLYTTPPQVQACQAAQDNKTTPDIPNPCIKPGDHSESILALDLDSGAIVWSKHLGAYDTWSAACLPALKPPSGPNNCPAIAGPDYDFGEAPLLLTVRNVNKSEGDEDWRDIAVAGQKSGIVWALDRSTGTLVWNTVSPAITSTLFLPAQRNEVTKL